MRVSYLIKMCVNEKHSVYFITLTAPIKCMCGPEDIYTISTIYFLSLDMSMARFTHQAPDDQSGTNVFLVTCVSQIKNDRLEITISVYCACLL